MLKQFLDTLIVAEAEKEYSSAKSHTRCNCASSWTVWPGLTFHCTGGVARPVQSRKLTLNGPSAGMHDVLRSKFTTKPRLSKLFSPFATFVQYSRGYSFHLCCFGNSFKITFTSLHFESEAWW